METKPPAQKPKANKEKPKEELSEQDQQLKARIDEFVEHIINQSSEQALEQLKNEVRTATTSMTSVPKPFKFLKDHYPALVKCYDDLGTSLYKKKLADFLSVLSMTFGQQDQRLSLKYLQEGTFEEFKSWGHEYLSHLSANIGQEYAARLINQEGADDLLQLVNQIVPQFMDHNQEHDAIDLLMEVEKLDSLIQFVNPGNIQRLLNYLLSNTPYASDQEELEQILTTAFNICLKCKEFTHAIRIALRIDRPGLIEQVLKECQDRAILKQIMFQLARHRYLPDSEIRNDQELFSIASNQMLSKFYLHLAKDLEVVDPKSPDQVYKEHLEEHKVQAQQLDSAIKNLAYTYTNAFVNAGFKKDALMSNKETIWFNKVQKEGQIAAVASIGMTNLWNNGNNELSEYQDMTDIYSQAGACLGIGINNTGLIDDSDPAFALLSDFVNNKEETVRIHSVMGLGIAYAGTSRLDLLEILTPIVVDTGLSCELSAMAALALGLIFVGKCTEDVSGAILETLMERQENVLDIAISRYFAVALGLLFLGQSERCEAVIETLGAIQHRISKYAKFTVISFAYASTGNVLKVQELLQQCVDHVKDPKESEYQQVAVLGIALVASSEDIGSEMAHRILQHILQFCDINVKRAVPLAIALLNVFTCFKYYKKISNPKIAAMDLLLKLAHDPDNELSYRSVLCLGLVGAGSNNSRIADILRGLAVFNAKDSNGMFMVRVAQGLLHMGKGLLSLQPYYSDRFLLNKVSMSGILILLHGCFQTTSLILGKNHTLLYYLSLAMYPRMCFAIDENLENLQVQIRVGQAVDAVGQAGKPKRITGFQTHTSPVLISTGERGELGNDEYIPIQDIVLENFVILKKNPDYVPEQNDKNANKRK